MMQTYNPATLPSNDNINPYAFCVDVVKDYIIRKGKMIAYYGNLRFEALGSSMLEILTAESFNSPTYGGDYIVATGRGQLLLGDQGNDINSYDLENANMTLKAQNLLGFEPTLVCQECVIPGYLTLIGTGKILASSNGMVHFMEPPVRVDPEALVGWADCPTPAYHHDYAYVRHFLGLAASAMGLTSSGEERQIDFTGQGTVLVQSSEKNLQGRSMLTNILGQVTGLHKNELERLRDVVQQRLTDD